MSLFGLAVTSADLDRDSFADLAVLTRQRIALLYGGAAGLGARSQVITPASSGEQPVLDAITVGDFDGDHAADFAVSASSTHLVMVFRGTGTSAPPTLQLTFSKVPPGITEEDQIGNALAAGDITGDGRDDLVVGTGSPSEMDSYVPGFFFVPGSSAGLAPNKRQFITRGTPGLAAKGARVGNSFGNALVIADFDRDGFGDVAVGDSEGRDKASSCGEVAPCAGAVFVLPGTADGPTTRGRQHWALSKQGRFGGWDDEVSNNFGASLAAGDLNGDRQVDLAVAAPFDFTDLGNSGPGRVYVLYGARSGLGLAGRQVWSSPDAGGQGHRQGLAIVPPVGGLWRRRSADPGVWQRLLLGPPRPHWWRPEQPRIGQHPLWVGSPDHHTRQPTLASGHARDPGPRRTRRSSGPDQRGILQLRLSLRGRRSEGGSWRPQEPQGPCSACQAAEGPLEGWLADCRWRFPYEACSSSR